MKLDFFVGNFYYKISIYNFNLITFFKISFIQSISAGESVSIQFIDGNETVLRGPTTIKMISQHAYPPMPMPVQVCSIFNFHYKNSFKNDDQQHFHSFSIIIIIIIIIIIAI